MIIIHRIHQVNKLDCPWRCWRVVKDHLSLAWVWVGWSVVAWAIVAVGVVWLVVWLVGRVGWHNSSLDWVAAVSWSVAWVLVSWVWLVVAWAVTECSASHRDGNQGEDENDSLLNYSWLASVPGKSSITGRVVFAKKLTIDLFILFDWFVCLLVLILRMFDELRFDLSESFKRVDIWFYLADKIELNSAQNLTAYLYPIRELASPLTTGTEKEPHR